MTTPDSSSSRGRTATFWSATKVKKGFSGSSRRCGRVEGGCTAEPGTVARAEAASPGLEAAALAVAREATLRGAATVTGMAEVMTIGSHKLHPQ
jgi:hypothetical protein